MNRTAESYGRALFSLNISEDIISQCRQILESTPELAQALMNPAVTSQEKHRVIERIFPCEVQSFLKVLCDNGHMVDIRAVKEIYDECRLKQDNILEARLAYANSLNPELVEKLRQTIMKKYKKAGVKLIVKHDPSLISGFVLRIGDVEYDRSAKGKLTRLYRHLAWR